MTTKSVTITRPANTTAYTAGDVIGFADVATPANAGTAVLLFPQMGNPSTDFIITTASLRIDATSIPAGMTSLRLHLYKSAPDARLDNAAWIKTSANDKGAYLGYMDFTPAVVGGDLWVQTDGNNKQLKLAAGSSDVWAELVTTGGFTPASGTVFEITLSAIPA